MRRETSTAAANAPALVRATAAWLGTVPYMEAWEMQRRLHEQVVAGDLPNLLLLLEHPHVYTLGRRGKSSDVLASGERLAELGVETHHVDRGGEATYHGPGQLVGYPIVDLRESGLGPLSYVRGLSEAITLALADLGVRAESEGPAHRSMDRRRQDRRDRRQDQPRRHHARVRPERRSGPVLLRPHRPVRYAARPRDLDLERGFRARGHGPCSQDGGAAPRRHVRMGPRMVHARTLQ